MSTTNEFNLNFAVRTAAKKFISDNKSKIDDFDVEDNLVSAIAEIVRNLADPMAREIYNQKSKEAEETLKDEEEFNEAWSEFEDAYLLMGEGHASSDVYKVCRTAFTREWSKGRSTAMTAAKEAFKLHHTNASHRSAEQQKDKINEEVRKNIIPEIIAPLINAIESSAKREQALQSRIKILEKALKPFAGPVHACDQLDNIVKAGAVARDAVLYSDFLRADEVLNAES